MAKQLHVYGTAHIFTGTGSSGTLEELGVSVDGVTITINSEFDPVYTDHYGPKIAYDHQYFLQGVEIKCDLIWYETNVLNKWLAGGIPGASLIEGTFGFAGDLVVQNDLAARLLVKSTPVSTGLTTVEECWNFPEAILVDQAEQKVGVEKTVWSLTFRALPSQLPSASEGAVIWSHTCV